MNHDAVATALCGRYVKVAQSTGYLESVLAFPNDGALIGAYVVDAGEGRVRVTDDGDTLFNIARYATEVTRARRDTYREIARALGFALDDQGVISATCPTNALPHVMGCYMQAITAIADKAIKHRPKEADRFELLVGRLLEESYSERLQRRVVLTGLSGHQLQFPFGLSPALDASLNPQANRLAVVQPVAARDDQTINWTAVYETGGKFKDVRSARDNIRLIAVLENSKGADQASRFFADTADVAIYTGGPLLLAA
jgi:hypothetical protein